MSKRISQFNLNNLIAQTNYLSSMLQTYQSMLVKKHFDSESKRKSRKSSSEGESIFVESDSEKKNRSNCFSEPDHNQHLHAFYFNNQNLMDQLLEEEMLQRPTGYPRDEETKKTREKIDTLEKSIQACHAAISMQFQIKKELEEKNLFEERESKKLLVSVQGFVNQVKIEEKNPIKKRKNHQRPKKVRM